MVTMVTMLTMLTMVTLVTMLTMVTMGGDPQPGCLAGAYQPNICGCQFTPFVNPM